MVISKILESTLTAGSTAVVFTDSEIPNSLIRVYSTDDNLAPVSYNISGNTLTITYPTQTNDKYVAIEIVKASTEIVDDLTSTATDKALSAKQGKTLKDAIDAIVIPTVPENITDLDDVNVTSISNGQVLAWDSVSEKFVNVTPSSGGSSIDYSTTEQKIGTWINGEDLFQKTISIGTLPNNTTKSVAHGITDIAAVVEITGACYFQGVSVFYARPLPMVDTVLANNIRIDLTGDNITVKTAADWSTYTAYVNIRYTKTS